MAALKIRFIFNPRAGCHSGHVPIPERLRSFIAERGLSAQVVATERQHHATELARTAVEDGCDLVVAVGGDGMISEVAQSLVGSAAVLGLIPCGSGNGLGRHLGLVGPDERAFRTLLDGRPREIDTATANGIPFFNVMGAGFDAEVGRRFNRVRRRGLAPYFRIALGAWFNHRPEFYTITDDAGTIRTRASLVAVANGSQYGGGACIAPGARIDDGRLDLVVVKPAGVFRSACLLVRLFRRSFDRSPAVIHRQAARFLIERGAPGPIHTDGEVHETAARIEVLVKPRSLRVMAPV
jgi:YegS/Rv2252/BmrU family lipid kinase